MSNKDKIQDKSLEALLAGTLSDAEAKRLVELLDNEEADDKNMVKGLVIEQAPETLRKNLRKIPQQTGQGEPIFPYRTALTLISIAIIAVLLVMSRQSSDTPTPEQIEQARQELAIAFNYLQQAGRMTDVYVKREVGHTVQNALVTGINHGIN